jgi:hypothetical protein
VQSPDFVSRGCKLSVQGTAQMSRAEMEESKEILRVVVGVVAVAVCVWLWLRANLFLYERGWVIRRSPKKIEVQTLFHGNTKDDDQI